MSGHPAPMRPETPNSPPGDAPARPDDPRASEAGAAPPASDARPREIGGRDGPDPTRYGDWEKDGRCIDF